jgi:uncharacterized membrane protein
MTLMERLSGTTNDESELQGSWQREALPQQSQQQQSSWTNVSAAERAASLAAGSVLAIFALARRTLPGALVAGVGGALIFRAATGHSFAYGLLGQNTAQSRPPEEEIAERGIHVEQAFLINRSPADLYGYWRNFENLPRIMTHLKSVRVIDSTHSHWVAEAPRIAGGKVEWDAEIVQDQPDTLIAWRSLPGSSIDTVGQIRFAPAMGDRGTEVHVFMDYVPPAGRLGHWVATLFGESPRRQMRDDLRNFKRIMELGELPTITGQSRGTCTGRGTRQS